MGCGCKSNGVKKQVSQITKKTAGTSASTVNRETATPEQLYNFETATLSKVPDRLHSDLVNDIEFEIV